MRANQPAKPPFRRGRRPARLAGAPELPTGDELLRFFTLSDDLCCILGADGSFQRLNPAWEAKLGFAASELVGTPYLDLLHPDDRAATHAAHNLGVPVDIQGSLEVRFRCKDGSFRWFAWSFTPVPERGQTYAIAHDITESKRAEHEQRRLYAVAEGLRDILAVINSSRSLGEILAFITAQATRLLDVDAGQIYRLDRSIDPPDDTLFVEASHGFAADYVGAILKNAPLTISYQAIQRGAPIAVPDMADVVNRLLAQPTFGRGQQQLVTETRERFRGMLAVPLLIGGEAYGTIALYSEKPRPFHDEEIQLAVAFAAQAAQAIENARLREQVERAAIVEERRRLARELHDSVSQSLFSMSLLAQVLPDLWDIDRGEARAGLDQIRDLTRGALAEMRALLFELRPTDLGDHGLAHALREHVKAFESRVGLPVSLEVVGDLTLPVPIEQAFFRIAQEALANVARHAQARGIRLLLHGPAPVRMVIADDGKGFQIEQVGEGRFGLLSMRERAVGVGACFQIHSAANQGTDIVVEWPDPSE
jgi:PAS domain S-box-containing protein